MDYWFLFVLLSCCFHSQVTLEADVLIDMLHVLTKNLSSEHELVSILEPEVAVKILRDGFETVRITLRHVNERRHKVKTRIGMHFEHSDAILEDLVEALNAYLGDDYNDFMREPFVRACFNHPMHVDGHLHRRAAAKVNSLLHAFDTVKGMSDLGGFVIYSNFMILTLIQESILTEECRKAFFESKIGLNWFFAINRGSSLHGLRKLVIILKEHYLTLENSINGAQEVQDYVSDYQLELGHQGPQRFVNTVYEQLIEKYFWRNWLVVSFNERKWGQITGDIIVNSEYSFFIDKGYNRSIYVASPDSVSADVFTGNVDVCFEQSQRPTSCGTTLLWCSCYTQKYEFVDCLGAMDLKGVACLWHVLNMKFKGGSSVYKVYSQLMPQEYLGVHVNRTLTAEIENDFIVVL